MEGFSSLLCSVFQSQNQPSHEFTDEDEGGVKVAEGRTSYHITRCNCSCRDSQLAQHHPNKKHGTTRLETQLLLVEERDRGGNSNSHGAQSLQGHRRGGLEGASRARSGREFSKCFCTGTVLTPPPFPFFYFLTDQKPNRHLRWLKKQ